MARHGFFRIDPHTCGTVTAAPEEGLVVGDFDAVESGTAGRVRVTGHDTLFVDDEDPLAHGVQRV